MFLHTVYSVFIHNMNPGYRIFDSRTYAIWGRIGT